MRLHFFNSAVIVDSKMDYILFINPPSSQQVFVNAPLE